MLAFYYCYGEGSHKKAKHETLIFFFPFLFLRQSGHVALADPKLPTWTRLAGLQLTEACLPLL